MLELYKPHTNREAVGVWLSSDAKRPSKRSALVIIIKAVISIRAHYVVVGTVKTEQPRLSELAGISQNNSDNVIQNYYVYVYNIVARQECSGIAFNT